MTERDVSISGVILFTAAIYVIWTPVYFLLKPDPPTIPSGDRVEMILPTARFDELGRAIKGTYGFRQRDDEIEKPFVIYENGTPLPESNYELAPFNPANRWREVKFNLTDGSEPKRNGRNYYAVLPRLLPAPPPPSLRHD